jgi:hypothetical protein
VKIIISLYTALFLVASINAQTTTITPAEGKLVIGELVTGTWCAYCPLGSVAFNWMDYYYEDHWQGITIHNGDPMFDPGYDNGMAPFIIGYPSGLIDRGLAVVPAEFETIEQDFLERVVIPPAGIITNGAELNGNTLTVSLTVDFQIAVSGNYKLACIIVEDSVTGTSPSYSQANAYSTGLEGQLIDVDGTDWANEPPLVPASQMVYNHVGRRIAPSFTGEPLSETSYNVGDSESICYEFTLSDSWDQSQISIVGMLLDPTNRVDNGSSSSLIDAIAFGLDTSCVFSIYTLESWDCINGMTCVDPGTGQGQYPNQSTCMINCLFAPPSWDCDSATGICSNPGTGLGTYSTEAACQAACVNMAISEEVSNQLIYPNPATDNIYISNIKGRSVIVKIYDISGRLILENKVSDKEYLNISTLPKGMYQIKLESNDWNIIRKLIKK